MDPAVTTTLHPRSFSCESRHYREKKKKKIRWVTHPAYKSFHYETFLFFIWHKCLLDQELICHFFYFIHFSENVCDCFLDLESFCHPFFFFLNFGEAYSENFHLLFFFCYHTQYPMHSLSVKIFYFSSLFIRFAVFCVKYDFWKVDPTFTAAVAHTRCACRH